MGEVPEAIRQRVEGLHLKVGAESTDVLSRAVAAQGLATREAAYKLYGRALEKLQGVKPETEAYAKAMAKAMDVATRHGETGAIRATFLKDMFLAARDKLTPGLNETTLEGAKQAVRQAGAKGAQYVARMNKAFDAADKYLGKLPAADQWQMQKDIETGEWRNKYQPASPEYKHAATIRTLLDINRELIQKAKPGALRDFYDNYFPHRWEGINSNADYQAATRQPLGKLNALKRRYYDTLQAGEDAGLKPVEYNPARAAMNVVIEGAHFIKGQEILAHLDSTGNLATFKSPRYVPTGWEHIDPKVAGVGKYAPADIARMFNNYFDPGLFARNRALDTVRIYNSSMQTAAVSLSGYHVLLTSNEAFATDLSLGLMNLTHGNIEGAAKNFLQSATGPFHTLAMGIKSMKEYQTAGINGGPLSLWLKSYIEGGARPGISAEWDVPKFKAIQRDIVTRWKAGDWMGATNGALRYIPGVLRLASVPVQDFWVRNLKMGATRKMLEYELERLGPGASDAERKAAFREVSDSADNRFGQMVRDNLFWNHTAADAATLGFKFVDFNYGSIREFYGAAKDIPRAAVGAGVSHRLAHAFGFASGLAIGGAVLNYALTGEGPKSKEDYFFPRNGRTGADGKPERVMMASYLRSVYEMAKPAADLSEGNFIKAVDDAGTFAKGRFSPAVAFAKDLFTHRNWQGESVLNPHDTAIQQLGSLVRDFIRQGQPISMGAWDRAEQQGGTIRDKVLSVAGIQGVPQSLGLTKTPAELELQQQLRETHGGGFAAPEQIAHERAIDRLVMAQENKSGKFTQIWREEAAAGHLHTQLDKNGRNDLDVVMDRVNKPFIERVKELPLPRVVDVLEKAQTPLERSLAREAIGNKLDQLGNMNPRDRAALWNRIVVASRQATPAR